MKLVKTTSPDLVVVDITLVDSNGIDLVKQLHSRFPQIRILVVSSFEESLYAERALRAGAHGYINKREVQERIVDALREVLNGRTYLSSEMTQRLLNQAVTGKKPNAENPIEQLSNRELEVFRLIGEGKATSEIARRLHLSVHTIESHREKIRHKLEIRNGTELIQRAVQWVLENDVG